MNKIILITFLAVFLTACSDSSKDQTLDKAPAKAVKSVEESAKKPQQDKPKKKLDIAEVDEHHGHDHAKEDHPDGFQTLSAPYATDNSEKVVVYDFFGYLCGHCYDFEPQMTRWTQNKPGYVEVVKVPLNFNRGWDVLQLGYITAKSMGVADQNHRKVFQAIHEKNTRFRTIEDLAQWYANNSSVTKDEFLSTAQSFIIDSNVRKADRMGMQMQITATPTIVVNGKFKPVSKLKSREDVLKMMDELVEKEAKAMGIIGSN